MKLFRGQPDSWQWKPSNKDTAYLWLGLGVIFYLEAFVALTSPSQSSLTGRWGWLHVIFFNIFGFNGDLVLYLSFGTASLIFASLKLKSTQ